MTRAATRPMAFITRPGVVEMQATPLAPLGDDEVKVQVKAASICGSDLHIFKGKHPVATPPVAVGHELAGVVVEVGQAVKLVAAGDRVAIEPVIACRTCEFCRSGDYNLCENVSFQYREGQGSFTPYFVVAEDRAHRLPDSLSDAEGALMEPLSVAVHAVRRAGLQFGQTCAVVGDGSIGLLIAAVCRAAGARAIYLVGSRKHKLAKALEVGATAAFAYRDGDPVAWVLEQTGQRGVDVAFEAVGTEATLVQALRVLRKGGTAVVAGLFEEPQASIPANLFVQREISLAGTQGYCRDFPVAIVLAASGRVDLKAIISHRLPLSDLQHGFEMQFAPDHDAIKVVVDVT